MVVAIPRQFQQKSHLPAFQPLIGQERPGLVANLRSFSGGDLGAVTMEQEHHASKPK